MVNQTIITPNCCPYQGDVSYAKHEMYACMHGRAYCTYDHVCNIFVFDHTIFTYTFECKGRKLTIIFLSQSLKLKKTTICSWNALPLRLVKVAGHVGHVQLQPSCCINRSCTPWKPLLRPGFCRISSFRSSLSLLQGHGRQNPKRIPSSPGSLWF